MVLISFALLSWLAAPPGPPTSSRFVAASDGLVHASLLRSYADLPADLEVVELAADGTAQPWQELRSFTPENTQTHPGRSAFRAGRVRQGHTYELRASLPGRLAWTLYPDTAPTPVEAGMSWLIRSADAWLANQPRQGAIARQGQPQHPEARACIACHITQFSTRAYLTAAKNGYRTPDEAALGSVLTRLRENPRPLYGHPGVNWARVIYSARTVSSRLPTLLALSPPAPGDRELTLAAARFLRLSDECGAGQLRSEADGSKPDVSAFEIGWQTVQTFRLAAAAEPGNPDWHKQAACVAGILERAQPANVIDAAWAIIARARLGLPTSPTIAHLLRYQQADGRFGLNFSPDSPPADFISYHVLYALAVAGHRGPAVDRLAAYTRHQQRPDGSWKGAPVYKGFDTPFRETQFAVMALSELAPRPSPAPLSVPSPTLSQDPWRGDRDAYQRQLLTRMSHEPLSPSLVESLAATLDENLSQLREWQRALRRPSDQDQVEQALRADSQRQATLLSAALRDGPRPVRLGVLSALSTMVGVTGWAHGPRVGNDVEAPQILADSGSALEHAILACLSPEDPELTRAAIRAGTALGDVLTPRFTKAMLRLLPQYGAEIAEAYGENGRSQLMLSRGEASDPELLTEVKQILEARQPRSLALLLPMLSALEPGHRFTREPDLSGAMERLLRDRSDGPVLQTAGVFADVVDGPLMRTRVLDAMVAQDPAVVRAAVDVVLERYVVNPRVVELTLQFLAKSQGLARRMLLDSLDPQRLRFNLKQVTAYSPPPIPIPLDGSLLSAPFLQEFVLSSLQSQDPQVQAAALDLTRKQAVLRRNPAIAQTLAALSLTGSPRTRAVTHTASAPEAILDFEFFREKVNPILTTPGADGRSCAMCHASNARFPLRTDARANFRTLAAKVNVLDPVASPVLVKPLLPGVTTDGDVFGTSHNGGRRWPANTGSAEYQAILEWIRGGTLAGSR